MATTNNLASRRYESSNYVRWQIIANSAQTVLGTSNRYLQDEESIAAYFKEVMDHLEARRREEMQEKRARLSKSFKDFL